MGKITEKELLEGLTQLKEIKPDKNWVIFCRKNLTLEMDKDKGKEILSAFDLNSVFATILRYISNPHPVLKPVAAFVLIFGFMFSGSLVVIAKAKNSLPGDRLFSVKIALEEAKLLTTTSAEGKAQVQTDMIAARIDELNKIISGSGSMEQKQPKIEETVNSLQRHLLGVKDELPKLNSSEAKKMVEMAKKIDASAVSAEQSLSQAKLALPADAQKNLTDKIADAADEADKTSTKALEMMVEKKGEGGISDNEIAAKVDDRIQKTQQMVKDLSEKVNNSAIADKLPINATIILDESDKAIGQAKVYLEKGDFAGALQIIRTATEMVKNAQQMVDSASSPDEPEPNDTTNNNATSTQNITPSATSSPSSILDLDMDIVNSSTVPATPVFDDSVFNK